MKDSNLDKGCREESRERKMGGKVSAKKASRLAALKKSK